MSVNGRLRKGQRNKGQPKYMNKVKFQHNKNSKLTKYILELPNVGLCERCTDVIEWKKAYRKYKPLQQPSSCCKCNQRTVTHSYHQICGDCQREHRLCAKCLTPYEGQLVGEVTDSEVNDHLLEQVLKVVALRERQRRTIMRRMESEEGLRKSDLLELLGITRDALPEQMRAQFPDPVLRGKQTEDEKKQEDGEEAQGREQEAKQPQNTTTIQDEVSGKEPPGKEQEEGNDAEPKEREEEKEEKEAAREEDAVPAEQ